MEAGKIPENVLKRAVFGRIGGSRPEVLVGAGVGEDCAALSFAADEIAVLSTDPITGTAKDIGKLAVQITANDLASSGAEPVGILVTVLLPVGSDEAVLAGIMKDVGDSCRQIGIVVIGGHTEVTEVVARPVLSVTGVGKVKKGHLIKTSGGAPGMDLIVTKQIALEGTSMIAKERETELMEHFPAAMIDSAKDFDQLLSVVPEGRIAARFGAAAMHDVTEGGIFGALWEMAEASGVGIDAELHAIPIRQETVEICEFYDLNPYQLISSGSMLIAAADGIGLCRALADAGIDAAIIGRMTDGNDRVLHNGSELRYLEPPHADEFHRILS